MKKLKSIFLVFCILVSLCPLQVFADSTESKFFKVDVDIGKHLCVAPGDTFTETFYVKNKSGKSIKVRVCDVDNINNSTLYSILKAGWVNEAGTSNLGKFDDLTTDWFTIGAGQTLGLELDMYFPFELGNDYQGTELRSEFVFECRVPKDGKVEINNVPYTGDNSNTALYATLAICSGFAIILLLKKRKEDAEEN